VEFGGKICEDAGVHTCVAFAKIKKKKNNSKKLLRIKGLQSNAKRQKIA
jgi:hypothetical protein